MDPLVGLTGLVIITVILSDIVQTTLNVEGSGPLSKRLARALWALAMALHKRKANHRLLAQMGLIILVALQVFWTAFLWLGWTLLFLWDRSSVIASSTGEAADLAAYFYFTGFTWITLGIGDYVPNGAVWQFVTVCASIIGFFIVTLTISFILSVLQAVVQKRKTAAYISSLGATPYGIVLQHWDGQSCASLQAHLSSLISDIGTVSQQHLSYPVLHYYHSANAYTSFPVRLAALDEALGFIEHGLSSCEATRHRVQALQKVVGYLLGHLESMYLQAGETPPPYPDLDPLKAPGLATVSEEMFRAAVEQAGARRRLLAALVEGDGWEWRDVYAKDG